MHISPFPHSSFKKLFSPVLAAVLVLSLSACGQKPVSTSSSDAAPGALSIALSAPETVPDEEIVGYYEELTTDENGAYRSLLLYDDHTGVYYLQDIEGELWDETTVDWGDGRITLGYGNTGTYTFDPVLEALHIQFDDTSDKTLDLLRLDWAPEIGAYCQRFTETLDGETFDFEAWVVLGHDHLGYILAQDKVDISWVDGAIYDAVGEKIYDYALTEGGDLLLLRPDGREDIYSRSDELPYYLRAGAEYSPDNLIGSWVVTDIYKDEEEEFPHMEPDADGFFSYLEFDINEAGELTAHFRYDSNGGFIDVPSLDVQIMDGCLFPYYYNESWFVELSGTGTVNDREREPRPYEVMPAGVPGSQHQWVEMRFAIQDENWAILEYLDLSDSLYEPLASTFYLSRSMG